MNTQTDGENKAQTPRQSRAASQKKYLGKLYGLMAAIIVLLVALLSVLPRDTADSRDMNESDAGEAVTERPAASEGDGPIQPTEQPRAEQGEPETQEPEERSVLVPSPEPDPPISGYLAIVIDDVGNDLDALKDFLAVPASITFAVLPQRRFSVSSADAARAAGREVIMHLPMEPLGGQNPGEGAITVSLSADEIAAIIDMNLQTIPGAVGANNHMGSKATADPRVMHAVLSVLQRRGLFFLDSRTNPDTIAAPTARMLGMPFVERSVFLDNVADRGEIAAQLQKGVTLARERGYAVLIGHVTVPELATVLQESIPKLAAKGVAIEPLSAVVERAEAVYARAGN
jgi:polysaccharide deacetylase 2 family uncharacterized protein YibQ